MTTGLLRALLAEPAVVDPPRRVRRDWVVLAVMVITVMLEGLFSATATWAPASIIAVLIMVIALLWRRTHPLAVTGICFGTVFIAERLSQAVNDAPFEYYSAAFLLIAPYALFRWGSGRDAAIGLAVMVIMLVSSLAGDWTGIGDAIGGTLVVVFPAALGLEVRHLVGARDRNIEEVKIRERETLARELHDTVAHHVSAIAIQAQAGRIVGRTDPHGALDALKVIEHEASRTLAEMRVIVGALRGHEAAELAPQPQISELHLLGGDGDLAIEVRMPDDLGDVGSTVEAAVYRVAQEAITNARRHSRDATLVTVVITADDEQINLTVDDDGRVVDSIDADPSGFGLIGMSERAQLLGGTLTAGPCREQGWRVEATIPRNGGSS